MATQHREVEEKYDVAPDAPLPEFAALAGVVAVGRPRKQHLSATYFDTADLRLAGAGITLRRRTGGSDAGWHLKLPSDGSKQEVREPLGRARRAVPKRLRETVTALVRDQKLVPVAEIDTRRTERTLLDAEGRVLAEVADDHVVGHAELADHAKREWREVEVELAEGDEQLLAAAAELLIARGASPATVPSKLARTLGDRLPGPRAVAARSEVDETALLVHYRLAEQLDALVVSDPLVREDLPDGVHAMRVATRRLRSALATYRPFLGREITEPLREELKWLGGVLGDARDAEVQRGRLLDRLAEVAEQEPGTLAGVDEARARIEAELEAEYAEAHRRCLDAIGSRRYLALLDRLEDLVSRPTWTEAAREPIGTAGVDRVRHEWKRVRERVETIDESGAEHGLHESRKAMKRLRYAVEPLRPVYGKDAKRVVKRLRRMQDLLGDHHDAVTSRTRLTALAERAAAAGENALVYGLLHARATDVECEIETEFERAWPKAAAKIAKWLP